MGYTDELRRQANEAEQERMSLLTDDGQLLLKPIIGPAEEGQQGEIVGFNALNLASFIIASVNAVTLRTTANIIDHTVHGKSPEQLSKAQVLNQAIRTGAAEAMATGDWGNFNELINGIINANIAAGLGKSETGNGGTEEP